MATIQLASEVVTVERLVDAHDHDEAFRQLILLRDRYGRRPEYRYLQALFDSTFKLRSDRELIPQVIALVGEQPDFTEAIALLGYLYNSIGERDKAEVFAREALRSKSPSARRRAREVLGLPPEETAADAESDRKSSATAPAVEPPAPPPPYKRTPTEPFGKLPPVVMPTAGVTPAPAPGAPEKRSTREFVPPAVPATATAASPATPATKTVSDEWRLPSEPPSEGMAAQRTTLDGIQSQPSVPLVESAREGAAPAHHPTPGAGLEADLGPDSHEAPTVRHVSTAPDADALASEAEVGQHAAAAGRFAMSPLPESQRFDERAEHSTQPSMHQTARKDGAVETIRFSPVDAPMPPPPTIPPEAFGEARKQTPGPRPRDATPPSQAPVARNFRSQGYPGSASSERDGGAFGRVPEPPARRMPSSSAPPIATKRTQPEPRLGELAGDGLTDRTGIDRERKLRNSSRPAMAIPPSIEVQRQWFRYARTNQIQRPQSDTGDQFSTAATLLDLAERVVEGSTPLADQPIPLDRRGLIQVEQRLDVFRRAPRPAQAATERAAVTAAAAFLLALLLKECDGRAADTSAEDGACKVVLPAGANVRPLLVAAAYARSRGPGLVETFDRAATSHMRRAPTRPGGSTDSGAGSRRPTHPPAGVSESELTVLRRDLDAGTLALFAPDVPAGPPPRTAMRLLASEFWGSQLGREIASASRRVGTFTLADVDAIERYAAKSYGPVGFAPPGSPWPWMPPEDVDETIFAWGAVLGEVLNALYTGRWEADPGNPDDRLLYRVVLTGGVVAWPVAKVYLRLARGITHDLSAYVDVVGRVVGRQTLSSAAWP